MYHIKVYTKKITPGTYDAPLAHSVHFSLCENIHGENPLYHPWDRETPLHHGYGILFPNADISDENTILERGIANPRIGFDGTDYVIFADKIDHDGNFLGTVLCWKTKDFIHFGPEESIASEGIRLNHFIEIPDELYPAIERTWLPLPGSVKSPVSFPLSVGYADPVIFKWDGAWYLLATNDNLNDIGLYIRRADTVGNLFCPVTHGHDISLSESEKTFEESCILPYDESRSLCQTFWAPEFHVIGGEAYILFAVSGKAWGPQCHMMHLKRGCDLLCESSWEDPIPVVRKDGSSLAPDGISLDMTYIKSGNRSYVAWSYRHGIGSPLDTGSMIYIATIDEEKPWVLTSEPVLLTRPLYGFDNVNGTINNEGPHPLYHDGKIFLSYSGGDACGYYYSVSFLVADDGADLLAPASWAKMHTSVLNSSSIPGIIGPGHNSFFTGDDGDTYIAYHAQDRGKYNKRCSTYHKVFFTEDGFPRLDAAVYTD